MNRLILHPQDMDAAPENRSLLVDSLRGIQLIAEPLTARDGYLAGERFLQLITFLGCMPYVVLEQTPQAEQEFCFVHFPAITPQATLRTGSNTVRPRCPHCNGAILDWWPIARAWPEPADCPRCHTPVGADALRWRENAGLGRAFIEIAGIHPSEAVPSDELLKHLEDSTGFAWKWFYVQS